jgi:hypothetical protein
MSEQRFHDGGAHLSGFSDEYAVVCSACGGQATVYADGPRYTCGNCGRSRSAVDGGWQGKARAEIRQACSRCGESISRSFEQCAPRPSKIEAACRKCEAVYSFSLFWKPLGQGSGQDPYFGCDLWYMAPCMGHLLWAFNEEHLRFLRSYVSVSLRQREPGRNASLASRLPGWMLSGKNRTEVLGCIDRLLAKAPK